MVLTCLFWQLGEFFIDNFVTYRSLYRTNVEYKHTWLTFYIVNLPLWVVVCGLCLLYIHWVLDKMLLLYCAYSGKGTLAATDHWELGDINTVLEEFFEALHLEEGLHFHLVHLSTEDCKIVLSQCKKRLIFATYKQSQFTLWMNFYIGKFYFIGEHWLWWQTNWSKAWLSECLCKRIAMTWLVLLFQPQRVSSVPVLCPQKDIQRHESSSVLDINSTFLC